jgi:hypothetical protein
MQIGQTVWLYHCIQKDMKTIQLKLTKRSVERKLGATVLEHFIKACQSLNASVFEPYIEEDQVFEDVDKYRFLQLMKEQFERCEVVGITKLQVKEGKCMGCQRGKTTYEFFDGPQMRFAYVVLYSDKEVSDIFQCQHSSSVFSECSYPF